MHLPPETSSVLLYVVWRWKKSFWMWVILVLWHIFKNIHVRRFTSWTSKVLPTSCPETSERKYQLMLRKTLEGRRPHLYSVESLKSLTVINLLNFTLTATTGIITHAAVVGKVFRSFQFHWNLPLPVSDYTVMLKAWSQSLTLCT